MNRLVLILTRFMLCFLLILIDFEHLIVNCLKLYMIDNLCIIYIILFWALIINLVLLIIGLLIGHLSNF